MLVHSPDGKTRLGQAKLGTWNSIQVSYVGGESPVPWANFFCFPRYISRGLGYKRTILIRDVGCSKLHHDSRCYNADFNYAFYSVASVRKSHF